MKQSVYSQQMSNVQEVQLTCADGIQLAATLYHPSMPKAAVMIAPATGIKRVFYHSFAKFLSENGYAVLTFDNRGIGDSRQVSINDGNPSLVNWGKQDMTAALSYLQTSFPNIPYHLIGHSAGGQLVGLMENAKDLSSMFNVCCSSGSLTNITFPFIMSAHFFMNVFIPLNNLLFRHTKSQWVGMGEPLPKTVAAQWRKWCNGKGYVKVYLDEERPDHLFDELEFPSLWLHALDDQIANLENVKDMIRVYPNIEYEIRLLDPEELGYKEIGHMKFFSSKKKDLWKYAVDWLEKN